jgi:hypothetical protein
MQDLFTQALGINSPWFIKDVSFDNKQLNIHIDFKKGTKFTDSSADTKAYTAYDTKLLSGKLDLNRVNGFLPTFF